MRFQEHGGAREQNETYNMGHLVVLSQVTGKSVRERGRTSNGSRGAGNMNEVNICYKTLAEEKVRVRKPAHHRAS